MANNNVARNNSNQFVYRYDRGWVFISSIGILSSLIMAYAYSENIVVKEHSEIWMWGFIFMASVFLGIYIHLSIDLTIDEDKAVIKRKFINFTYLRREILFSHMSSLEIDQKSKGVFYLSLKSGKKLRIVNLRKQDTDLDEAASAQNACDEIGKRIRRTER